MAGKKCSGESSVYGAQGGCWGQEGERHDRGKELPRVQCEVFSFISVF